MSHTVVLFLALFLTANANAATYRIFGEGSPRGSFETIVLDLVVEPESEEIDPNGGLPQITYQNLVLTGEIGGNTIGGTQLDQEITFYDFQRGDLRQGSDEGFLADVRFSSDTFVSTIQIALYDRYSQDIWQLNESGDMLTAAVANSILSRTGNVGVINISFGGTPFRYQITNIGEVPLPATAWLFLSAMGAGFGLRRLGRDRRRLHSLD
jgi:hypothetical protein